MSENKFVIVETEHGPVEGVRSETAFGVKVNKFLGIPYMKAPIGKLRFRDAQPPEKWTEPLKATKEVSFPVFDDFFTKKFDGEEDGGVVNVYTKNVQPEKLYPVMVFIHGGAFRTGSGRTDVYGPDYILEKDVVFVSFNYRLGPFGFLSLDDPSLGVPGNAGLKDQTMVLKWVQKNIEKFGGDPDIVTLFGESAGGASVHYHMISDQSKGLFKRAIPMSGVALNSPWTLPARRNWAQRLVSKLDYSGPQDDKSILEFLESVDAFEVVKAYSKILTFEEKIYEKIGLPFGPTIEPYPSDNCFIPKHPLLMMREAWSNEIDCMIGGCSNEGIIVAIEDRIHAVEELKDPRCFTPIVEIGMNFDDPKNQVIGEMLKELYYGRSTPTKANLQSFFSFFGDYLFWHGFQRTILSRASAPKRGKTFFYRFDIVTALNVLKKMTKTESFPGAEHTADLFHMFQTIFLPLPAKDSIEFANVKKTVAIWTNFAITGNPNCSELGDVEWTPVDSPALPLKCLNIGTEEAKFIELPETERLAVWDLIYKQAGVDLY